LKKRFLSPEIQNHLWILIATAFAAPFSAVMVLLTKRLVDLETAGIMQYAYAVAFNFGVLIVFSVSQIQVVDVREEYSFKTYLNTRVITAALTSVVFVVFLFITGQSGLQLSVLLLYYLIVLVDFYFNVYTIDFHQKGMIRVTGRMRASGFAAILLSYISITYFTKNVILAMSVAVMAILLSYLIWVWCYRKRYAAPRTKVDFSAIKRLLIASAPVFVLTFITTFLATSPNIFLGEFTTMETVAIFAILLTPGALFLVFLHAVLLGDPLPKLSEAFASGDLKKFSRFLHILLLLAVAGAVPFLTVVYFVGIPFLSWLYNEDLSSYLVQLMVVCGGTICYALTPIIGMTLIIMKRQRAYMYSSIAVGATIGPLVAVLVWLYGINGAMYSYFLVNAPLSLMLYTIFRKALRTERLKKEIKNPVEVSTETQY